MVARKWSKIVFWAFETYGLFVFSFEICCGPRLLKKLVLEFAGRAEPFDFRPSVDGPFTEAVVGRSVGSANGHSMGAHNTDSPQTQMP